MQNVLLSRFILNLAEANYHADSLAGSTITSMSEPRFTRIVGYMAGSSALGTVDEPRSEDFGAEA